MPEWFLPTRVILKRQKPQWEEEFEREKAIYEILRPAQGSVVPVCYGEVRCCLGDDWHASPKRRSLILSELGGWDLNGDDCPKIAIPKLEKMLKDAFREMRNLGVVPDDLKLENVRFLGDKVMFIDFEIANTCPDSLDYLAENGIDRIVSKYQVHQEALEYEHGHGWASGRQ